MSIEEETRTGTIQAQKKVADQLRSIIEQGRRTVEESRFLHKEIQTVLEQSRLALLASHHLIARVNRRPRGGKHNG
jgi:flagellar biosynthesis/type III secretory pathway chaperone